MKTSELTGPALDWAVSKCEGKPEETLDPLTWECTAYPSDCYNYSTDWSIGGPIIEREGIDCIKDITQWLGVLTATAQHGHIRKYGPTPLVAAMRCYVASMLGDQVEVPKFILWPSCYVRTIR